jgi:hypothetical protein
LSLLWRVICCALVCCAPSSRAPVLHLNLHSQTCELIVSLFITHISHRSHHSDHKAVITAL